MSEYTREEILKLIEENGGPEGLDLTGKNLQGIDLSRKVIEAELQRAREGAPPRWYSGLESIGINLWGAKLQEADLRSANLQGANLIDANLRRANLWEANLQEANLWEANLQEADLGKANLQEASLGYADLQGADLRIANLQEANLEDANLQEANLTGAKLQEARLMRVNFQGAKLMAANLQEAKLGAANLKGADLYGAYLQGAYLEYADLQEANLGDAALQGAFFSGVRLDHTEMARGLLGPAIGEELAGNYPRARDAYLRLKQNFDDLGDYAASSWAYRKERRMEKLEALQEAKKAWRGHDWKGAIPRGAKVVGDQLVEWVCDYGEGIWRVAGSLIAVWVAFALIYGLIAGVWGPWQDTGSGEIRHITRNPIDLLSFSLGAMTTVDPIRLEARPILAMSILTPLEALLGIFFAGLLGFVAGNRIRRS